MAAYSYRRLHGSLKEIRLVHLLPAAVHQDPIKIRIVHAPFHPPLGAPPKPKRIQVDSLRTSLAPPWTIEETDNGDFIFFNVMTGASQLIDTGVSETSSDSASDFEPQYEALSYTWGSDNASELAQVELDEPKQQDGGIQGHATLPIRPNLASALRHLRSNTAARVLWIDAICINQDDIEERNEQVKRMTDIYTLARGVIAWLGEESNGSKHALATLRHVGQQLESTKSGRVIAAPGASEPMLWRNDCGVSFDQVTWDALAQFVERPWFYRIWCWQEIKLGGRGAVIQCGGDDIPWNYFWLAILCLHNKDRAPSMRFRERCRHIVFLKMGAADHSMSNILDTSRSKGCADPRDKIYGLLGITPPSFSSAINVDYERSVEEVYKEAFLTHLGATKRLELLKHCDLARRTISGPTWVPDWSKTEFAAPILSEQLSSGLSRAWWMYSPPDVFEVVGKHFTTIVSTSSIAPRVEEDTLLAVKDWHEYLPHGNTYITGESMETAFALTLCMNRTGERHPFTRFLRIAEWVRIMRQILRLTPDNNKENPIYWARETANTIQKVRGRRFFTTATGHIGTAPGGARVGEYRHPVIKWLSHITHTNRKPCRRRCVPTPRNIRPHNPPPNHGRHLPSRGRMLRARSRGRIRAAGPTASGVEGDHQG